MLTVTDIKEPKKVYGFAFFLTILDVQAPSLEELKLQKSFVKLLCRQYRELRHMHRKHLRKVSSLSKEQNSRVQLQSIRKKRFGKSQKGGQE